MTQDASMKNTKKELLDIITKMEQDLKQKKNSELNPEKVKTEVKTKETIEKVEIITQTDLNTQIHSLKMTINRDLTALAERIEIEASKYIAIQESIKIKQQELETIYGIEEQAASLAAIIESQNLVSEKFDEEMADKKEKLEKTINETRLAWDVEKKSFQDEFTQEKKKIEKERQREEEEYTYNLQRTRAVDENNFSDKLAALEKEIEDKREQIDKHVIEKTNSLNEREKQLVTREEKVNLLEQKVENFPGELETAISRATEQLESQLTAKHEQEKALLVKGYEGDQKVLEAKLSALESIVKDQSKQVEKLNNQQEKAYQQVQDIAAKAVTGATERPQSITVKAMERDNNS